MEETGNKVCLHVYDLSGGIARQMSTALLGKTIDGIWHTGVAVFGNEYCFGGGIQCVPAGTTVYGTPVKVVDLGVTYLTKEIFEDYLREISPRYTMETYNLFKHNCNNFSNEVAQFLVGSTIPDYIIELPDLVLNSPGAALLRPMFQLLESTVNAGGAPQAPHFISPATATQTSVVSETPVQSNPGQSPRLNETSQCSSIPVKASSEPKTMAVPSEPSIKEDGSSTPATDPLAATRKKVQDEITREFATLMASGTLRASEAAALATRKVMERYGTTNVARG